MRCNPAGASRLQSSRPVRRVAELGSFAPKSSSVMLDLDSSAWSALEHAYGTAEDIPDLLRDLESFPPDVANDDGTWHALWSALCHQSDVYSASFAAVPHIVRLAAAAPDRMTSSFILLPTCIDASRLTSVPFVNCLFII